MNIYFMNVKMKTKMNCLAPLSFFTVGAFAVSAIAFAQSDVTYEYDELGRLKKTTYDNENKDVGYYYDAAGNREAVVVANEGDLPTEAPTSAGVIVVPLNGFTVIPLN